MFDIAFFLYGTPIDGRSVEDKPLGGTESAMIYMARALSKLGHAVRVYTNTEGAHEHAGVSYRTLDMAERELNKQPPDVFLGLRHMLATVSVPARYRVYFSPDAYDQPFVNHSVTVRVNAEKYQFDGSLYPLTVMQRFFDAIFVVGRWQAETFRDRFSIPPAKLFVAHNGIDTAVFDHSPPLEKRRPSVVYASTPFRGLDHLLRLFPEIRKRVPTATCDIFSGMQLYGLSNEEDRDQYGLLYKMAEQPGVTLHGPVTKSVLARHLRSARLMAYPNTFAETFCIAALEAQGAGLPLVTTNLAGLKERVIEGVHGHLISGFPGQPAYDTAFVERTVELLTDDERWRKMSAAAFAVSRSFDYDSVARRWVEHFVRAGVGTRPAHMPTIPVQNEKTVLLVEGVTKQVDFSEKIIRQHIASHLRGLHFPKLADAYET